MVDVIEDEVFRGGRLEVPGVLLFAKVIRERTVGRAPAKNEESLSVEEPVGRSLSPLVSTFQQFRVLFVVATHKRSIPLLFPPFLPTGAKAVTGLLSSAINRLILDATWVR